MAQRIVMILPSKVIMLSCYMKSAMVLVDAIRLSAIEINTTAMRDIQRNARNALIFSAVKVYERRNTVF